MIPTDDEGMDLINFVRGIHAYDEAGNGLSVILAYNNYQ